MTATDRPRVPEELVGTWVAEPDHTSVGFVAQHLGLTLVRGTFGGVEVRAEVAPMVDDCSVMVVVDVATLSTGSGLRDEHLLGEGWFDAGRWPELRYASTEIELLDAGGFVLRGTLSIRGRELDIPLTCRFTGSAYYPPTRKVHAGVTALGVVDRRAAGLDMELAIPDGRLAIAHDVRLEVEAQLVRAGQDKPYRLSG